MNRILLILFFCSISSCSYLKSYTGIDSEATIEDRSIKKTACIHSESKTFEIVGTNKLAAEQFTNFFTKFPVNKVQIDFLDKAIIWSLLQMSIAPHLAAPNSRLTIVASINGKKVFIDNYSRDKNPLPFIHGLEKLRESYQGNKSLTELAKLIDNNYPNHIQVDRDLELFIEKNHHELLIRKEFSKVFFRGKQGLRRGESYRRLKYSPLTTAYNRSKKRITYQSDSHLFTAGSDIDKGTQLRCNYDLALYKHSIYIASDNRKKALPFGIFDKKGNYFLGLSSIDFETPTPYNKTFSMAGSSDKAFRPAICLINDDKKEIILASSRGRDPGQLLYQLFIDSIPQSKYEIDKGFKAGRMIKLLNPNRVVIESKRFDTETINQLRGTRDKIYHSDAVGELIGMIRSNKRHKSGFIIDDRHQQEIFCR